MGKVWRRLLLRFVSEALAVLHSEDTHWMEWLFVFAAVNAALAITVAF